MYIVECLQNTYENYTSTQNCFYSTFELVFMFGIFYLGNFVLAEKAKTNRAFRYIFLKTSLPEATKWQSIYLIVLTQFISLFFLKRMPLQSLVRKNHSSTKSFSKYHHKLESIDAFILLISASSFRKIVIFSSARF